MKFQENPGPHLISVSVGNTQLPLVVEHFLEVWYVPPPVCGVPGEPFGDMVIDPSQTHHLQGVSHHGQSLLGTVRI